MKPEIKTPRLVLNDMKGPKDLLDVFNIAQRINEKAKTTEGYYPYYAFQADDEKELREKIIDYAFKVRTENKDPDPVTYRYAIRLPNNQLIGSVAADMKPTIHNGKTTYGDLGYFIDPLYGSKGYALEAVVAVLFLYFQKFERMDVTAHPENKYSTNLINKIGGKPIGFIEKSDYKSEPRKAFVVARGDFAAKMLNISNQKLLGRT